MWASMINNSLLDAYGDVIVLGVLIVAWVDKDSLLFLKYVIYYCLKFLETFNTNLPRTNTGKSLKSENIDQCLSKN